MYLKKMFLHFNMNKKNKWLDMGYPLTESHNLILFLFKKEK